MIKNKLVVIKLLVVFAFFGLISCESDIDNVGTDLVNNDSFETGKRIFEVVAYNQNVEKSRVDNTSVTNLGILNHDKFGLLKADFVTQVGLPIFDIDFENNPSIDDVFIDIPYDFNTESPTSDGRPQFSLNNIYGNQDVEFNLKVYQLGTYLNTLDEENPTENKKYYSNQVYTKLAELHNSNFKPNANDTMYRVPRLEFTGENRYDTIKKVDKAPSIKLQLDNDFFTNNFINNGDSEHFNSLQNFIQYFNGLYFEVTGDNGAFMQLDLSKANINLYYTTGVETDETDTDLNGDGDTDDENVIVRTKKFMQFPLNVGNGVKNNIYNRDYTTVTSINDFLTNPNITQGDSKLFIQGAAGSNAVLDIFSGMDLNTLRQENLLINEANLVLHIDKDESTNNDFIPNRLFLYKQDPDLTNDEDENTQIIDVITEGEANFDGNVKGEIITVDDENIANKLTYKFKITDYISRVLSEEEPTEPSKLVLKTYHSTDLPRTTNDTIIKNYSWNPTGVILYGNNIMDTNENYNKRLKLEIYYSKENN